MSVPLSERGLSKKQFYYQAIKLNKEITNILIRDFGMKSICKDLNVFTNKAKMNPVDKQLFENLCTQYHIGVEASYPYWLIEHYRDTILGLLKDLILNITAAYTIFPNSVKEFYDRRHYQWLAIGNCEQLLQIMQLAIEVLPVDAEKFMSHVDTIDEEVELLRSWKKSENRILRAIQEKEANEKTG